MIAVAAALAFAGHSIWQIGKVDGDDREFAFSPGNYAQYKEDPTFIVGRSKDSDWPYVLPGPMDPWAGMRSHRDAIFFGLNGVSGSAGSCTLRIVFVDTHHISPPRLTLWVNGKRIAAWDAPIGAGDASVMGDPSAGRHAEWTAHIPVSDLHDGRNEIDLENASGSWVLFDAIRFEGPESMASAPVPSGLSVRALPQPQIVYRGKKGPEQPVNLEVTDLGPAGHLLIKGAAIGSAEVHPGRQTISLRVPAVKKPAALDLRLDLDGLVRAETVKVEPVRPWTVYLLTHSHLDIGYTDIQRTVLAMHERNFFDALTIAKESEDFPPEARNKYSAEGTWILQNLYLDHTPAELAGIVSAFKSGEFDCSAGYCNTLTALMRPEELMRSYGYSDTLRNLYGIDLQTASQTDVPGVTWGAVAALSQAEVKNLVLMPNPSDRIGGVLTAWKDKPFWWVSPSGKEKVFVWETASYGVAHGLRHFNGDRSKIFRTSDPTKNFIDGYIFDRLAQLAAENYPYDCIAFPWSGTDNFPVDGDVPAAVKHWNETYSVPRVVDSTFTQACDAFKKAYAAKIPVVRGDFTPYWEDGAGSSARETAMNRANTDRLVQAETAWAMTTPKSFDPKAFWRGWSDAILYSEHTWGAYNSVSEPDAENVRQEWEVKKAFADTAQRTSERLLGDVLPPANESEFSVVNTNSWPRTDLVLVPAAASKAGDKVIDARGKPVPSQRLHTGDLAVLAENVPAFGSVRLRVVPGRPFVQSRSYAHGWKIANADWQIELDPSTGTIRKLWSVGQRHDFADREAMHGINQYLYLPGDDLKNLEPAKNPRVQVLEDGPLVSKLRVALDAAGAKGLTEDVQIVSGLDRVDLTDTIDKTAVRDKEGVHFAFPFQVPRGQVRIHGPWAVIRPDFDQIPGSNKNWFNTQYFADVSNGSYGMTWTSLDAPLLEVGGITAHMLDGGFDPKQWIRHIGPTQTIYSWALNNHWYTNYRADQSGLLTFRYSLWPHGAYAPDASYRFGAERAEPLLVTSASIPSGSLLKVSDPRVVVSSIRPSSDGRALLVRLWCVGDRPTKPRLIWRSGLIRKMSLSDSTEHALRPCDGTVPMAGWQVVTIRAELR